MKYIVSGAAGFVGSHVCEGLLNDGHTVIGIDDFSDGLKKNLPIHKNFKLVVCNLCDAGDLDSAHKEFADCAGVFHLAASARIQPSIHNPSDTIHNNVFSTLNVLELMRRLKIPSIVYSASSSCYGRNKPPFRETQLPDCLNAYAASKLMGETLCKAYANSYGIKSVCLRYFNVYGPRSPTHIGAYSPVIGLFFRQALNGEPLTIVGDGSQTRDFTWIGDVVRANLAAMQKSPHLGDNGGIINIGTARKISILELAKKINVACGRNPDNIQFIPARPAEAVDTGADNTSAKVLLNLEFTALEDTFPALLNWYREELGIKDSQ